MECKVPRDWFVNSCLLDSSPWQYSLERYYSIIKNSWIPKLLRARHPKRRLRYYKESVWHFQISIFLDDCRVFSSFWQDACLIAREPDGLDLKESNSGYHHHRLLSQHQIFIEQPLNAKHVMLYMLRKHIFLFNGRHTLKDESKQMEILIFQSPIWAQCKQFGEYRGSSLQGLQMSAFLHPATGSQGLTFIYLFIYNYFIVVWLQLSAFSPHPSTPP